MKVVGSIFLILLVIPTTEIYLLMKIGQVVGAGWTIFGVVATAVVGAWLIKIQGLLTLQRGIETLRRRELPAVEVLEGLFLLIAAVFLITPGFVTDSIGFLCLITGVRRGLAKLVLRNTTARFTISNGIDTYEVDVEDIKEIKELK